MGVSSGYDRPGFVYVMESAGLYKIGWSSQPRKRLSNIKTASAIPVMLVGVIEGSREIESEWHWHFRHKRKHGEWFALDPEDIEYILHESFGIDRVTNWDDYYA